MPTKTIHIKFQSELIEHEPEFFEANITFDYSVDHNYGADADGGRGVETLFINDIKVHNCIDSQATLVKLPLNDQMMDDIWLAVWEDFQT